MQLRDRINIFLALKTNLFKIIFSEHYRFNRINSILQYLISKYTLLLFCIKPIGQLHLHLFSPYYILHSLEITQRFTNIRIKWHILIILFKLFLHKLIPQICLLLSREISINHIYSSQNGVYMLNYTWLLIKCYIILNVHRFSNQKSFVFQMRIIYVS